LEKTLRQLLPRGKFERVSPQLSRHMAAVKGRDNRTTEARLRFGLVHAGVRGWKLNSQLVGHPDFYFSMHRVVVFVDGCFWHGCKRCGHVPKKHGPFWRRKIERNRDRDRLTTAKLRRRGFRVVRFWEHELQSDLPGCLRRLCTLVEAKQTNMPSSGPFIGR